MSKHVKNREEHRVELDEAMERLDRGVREVFESGRWERYLEVMSRFHRYSANNSLLIAMQMPGATAVASYTDWKRKFRRQVRKGERGIRILAPVRYRSKVEDEDGDGDVEVVERLAGFRLASTFDVSQTDGEPLPEVAEFLDGTVGCYERVMAAIVAASPVPVVFEEMPGGVNGYFSRAERRIAIRRGMSQAQTVKTAVHELAHSRMHDFGGSAPKDGLPDRATREVQAESVAFVVASHYGLDTGGYSFGYIAGWASGRELDELKASIGAIRRTAHAIIEDIDAELG
jgi:antirestriction protein ArdC